LFSKSEVETVGVKSRGGDSMTPCGGSDREAVECVYKNGYQLSMRGMRNGREEEDHERG
jgi:hypothetical protein